MLRHGGRILWNYKNTNVTFLTNASECGVCAWVHLWSWDCIKYLFLISFFHKKAVWTWMLWLFYPHRRCIFIPWYGKNMGEGGLKWYKWEIIRCLQFIPFGNAVGRSESATCKNRVQVLSPCSSLGRGWYHTVPLAVRGASRAARNQTVKTISMRKFSRREEVELFRASHRKTWPDMRSSK